MRAQGGVFAVAPQSVLPDRSCNHLACVKTEKGLSVGIQVVSN